MEKIKLKIEIVKTLLNYISIVFFGTSSYAFINSDKLSGFKIIICSCVASATLVAFIAVLAVYLGFLRELNDE